jgi:hypothetical protein
VVEKLFELWDAMKMRAKMQETDEIAVVFIENLSKLHEANSGFPERTMFLGAQFPFLIVLYICWLKVTRRKADRHEFRPYHHLLLDDNGGGGGGGYAAAP